eukprot:TRINITY_DN20212_c0_g1_i1.p1 TRINITY_DN20212_c0_g1~~TRINITY_DN20212_c0_g1_i1.p1  ORF type:complete len:501 (+),score=94.26 TRINITY_DN20212_c0_g1_i1:146-1648(+)
MPVQARVEASDKNAEGVAIHRIRVCDENGKEWHVHKRFSDFVELDRAVRRNFASRLPPRHPIRSFFSNYSLSQERAKELNEYLTRLLRPVRQLSQDSTINEFLKSENESFARSLLTESLREEAESKPRQKYRCEDWSAIPDQLIKGPFEDFEISGDVYSTAYLLARNATPTMYSIWPWQNPDVRIVWAYLLFIVFSQLFVVLAITLWYPAAVGSEVEFVNCANATAVSQLHAQGFLSSAEIANCLRETQFSFQADLEGVLQEFRRVERKTFFYDSVLMGGDAVVFMIRMICCTWVLSQAYFEHFERVRCLFHYRDFSLWFLPLKNETLRNSWTIVIPCIQYCVLLTVTTVSLVIISAQDEPFDIVCNALAFTFIFEVGGYFNDPLAKRMSETKVAVLDSEAYGCEFFYLYPEYKESNAINDDGTYTDGGWYILMDEEKAGLLSDYKVRHNPDAYDHPSESIIAVLEKLLFVVPLTIVAAAAIRCGAHASVVQFFFFADEL